MLKLMSPKSSDDTLTIIATGILAFIAADVTHEALGHGLAVGAKPAVLTTWYFSNHLPAPLVLRCVSYGFNSLRNFSETDSARNRSDLQNRVARVQADSFSYAGRWSASGAGQRRRSTKPFRCNWRHIGNQQFRPILEGVSEMAS
jgi:hypothetical protein